MKKKILLSIVALFMLCFSMFGFVGCDSRANAAKLEIWCKENGTAEEITKADKDTVVARIDLPIHGLDINRDGIEQARTAKGEQADDYNNDGVLTSSDLIALKNILFINGFTIKYYDKNKTTGELEVKEIWTSYKQFINGGGQVSGFDLSKEEGTHEMTFSYNGVSCEICYYIG